ncbi:MAG: LysR family transcriptional regulator [Solirubrobacteraceae bacterium]
MPPDRARPVRPPELSELQTFVLAVEDGSIARAAGRLQISATAAAKRVRNLEGLAGRKLLDRSSKGVQPTSHGRVLYRRAVRSVAEAEALGELLREMRPGAIEASAGIRALLRAPSPEAGDPRRTADELEDAERLLLAVFHGVSDALALTTGDGLVADVNDAWCRLLGRSRDELVGVTMDELGVSIKGHTAPGDVTNTLVVRSGVHLAAIVRPANLPPRDVDLHVARIRIRRRDCVLLIVSQIDGGSVSQSLRAPLRTAPMFGLAPAIKLVGE